MAKLKRSKDDKIVAGVLGGVSEYLSVDSTVVRMVWLVALAFTGFVPGIVLYTLAILVLPLGRKRKS
jgi:phage shock protein PspC (stress-responsive transcriptional regulator)